MIPTAILRDTVTVEPHTGESASGPVWGEAVSYPARIEMKRTLYRQSMDSVVLSEGIVWMRPDAVIAVGDRVTANGRKYKVVAVEPQAGLLRSECLQVTLGRSES
jgi:hypothetical protein